MSYREYRSPKRQERERKERRKKKNDTSGDILSSPDKPLIIIVTFLIVIGFLAIFSATAPKCLREGVNLATFLGKQILYSGIGVALMLWFRNYDYKKLEKFKWLFLIVSIVLLIVACMPTNFLKSFLLGTFGLLIYPL
jgi:cell division protein FtsW